VRGDEQEKKWAFLMRAGNAGDADSYRRLLVKLTPVLRAAARRGLGPAGMADTDAEDVVQETLLAIHLKRQSWDEEAPFGPWLRAIARHNDRRVSPPRPPHQRFDR
jgi:RNA polymerase sigma-70 factor, ECF subfamily